MGSVAHTANESDTLIFKCEKQTENTSDHVTFPNDVLIRQISQPPGALKKHVIWAVLYI